MDLFGAQSVSVFVASVGSRKEGDVTSSIGVVTRGGRVDVSPREGRFRKELMLSWLLAGACKERVAFLGFMIGRGVLLLAYSQREYIFRWQ